MSYYKFEKYFCDRYEQFAELNNALFFHSEGEEDSDLKMWHSLFRYAVAKYSAEQAMETLTENDYAVIFDCELPLFLIRRKKDE
jgi:hypothetical protein